jgi:hypothetical protein
MTKQNRVNSFSPLMCSASQSMISHALEDKGKVRRPRGEEKVKEQWKKPD